MSEMKNKQSRKETSLNFSRSQFSTENPWDGNDRPILSEKTAQLNSIGLLNLTVSFWTILILLFLVIAGNLRAGEINSAKKAPKAKETSVVVNLNQDAKEAAEEYAYLLEQLLYLSTDYCSYFEKMDDRASGKNYQALANMCARISEEESYENVRDIIKEIEDLKKELTDRERELEALQVELETESSEYRYAHSNLKALKLTTSLREELESLDEQLEHEVVWRMEAGKEYQEAINTYVKSIIEESVSKADKSVNQSYVPRVRVFENEHGDEKVIVEVPGYSDEDNDLGYAPVAPTPVTPITPVTPVTTVPPKYDHFSGDAFFNEFKDSLEVSSPTIGIYITNAIGDIEISAWSERMVIATYNFAVVSDKQRHAEQLNKEIHLRIYPKQNKIHIESVMPPLVDPKMRVLNSRLQIKVPLKNDLFISNSSGNVFISEIRNDVVVKGAGCNINIDGIEGNTNISNSSGAIIANGILGRTVVQNRMGPVTLVDCDGDIELDNSFGPITMANCDGDAVIRNTGPVSIAGHIGNMEINNRSGLVDVSGIDGNLAVFNSFEPMKVRDINGSVKLVNANALVEAVGINGSIDINNRFAPINISSISGPIILENKSGDINLQLSRALSGNSSVVTSGGIMSLELSPRNNLLLTMELTNGDLQVRGFDATVEKGAAGLQTAKLKVGNGANSLAIKGYNTTVIVKPSQ